MTPEELSEYTDHLEPFRNGPRSIIPRELANVDYSRLEEFVARLDLSDEPSDSTDMTLVQLDEKMRLNGLGEESKTLLRQGLEHAHEVNMLVVDKARFKDGRFPEKLLNCFRRAYYDFYANGQRGDDLMELMCLRLQDKSGGGTRDLACVVALVAYLFERCDLFEKTQSELAHERGVS